MKKIVTIKSLKKLIKEALETITASSNEIAQMIGAMPAHGVALQDYVDSETGEIYLEKGDRARKSSFHPQYAIDRAENRNQQKLRDDLEDQEWAKEDEEWENTQQKVRADADNEYTAALREFAENWTEFKQEYGAEDEKVDLESSATDAAAGFFHHYPEWKHWAAQLHLSKDDILSAVSEFVYEAMITGKVP